MDFRELYAPYLDTAGPMGDGGFVSLRCPFHADRNPSAGFHVQSGVFNCYVCGSMAAPAFLAAISNQPVEECYVLVDSFRRDAGLREHLTEFARPATPMVHRPDWEKLVKKAQANLRADDPLVQEYMASRGLRFDTLVEASLGRLAATETGWKRDSLVFPYTYAGRTVGIRYRDIAGNKSAEPGCHMTLWGVDDLDQGPTTVIVTEGETDRLVVRQATRGRYTVVSTPTAGFRHEWRRLFEGVRQVIAIPQDDEASHKRFAQPVQHILPGTHVLNLPWKRKQLGKDVADWVRANGEEALASLIDSVANRAANWIWSGEEVQAWVDTAKPWLIENLLGRQQVGVIAGHPKSMKTFLALTLVRTVLSPGSYWCDVPAWRCGLQEPGRVLFLEEEGDRQEFRGRVIRTLDGTPWTTHTWYGHHLGFRIDEDTWVDQILNFVVQKDIDLLVIDPFQRTYAIDENEAGEMGTVWHRVQRLLRESKSLSILLLHHFNKTGAITDGWNALRGTSRIAAEVDLGIFVAKRRASEGVGVNLVVDGRAIVPPPSSSSNSVLTLAWDDKRGVFVAV